MGVFFYQYTDAFVFDSVQIGSQCVIKPQTTTNLLKLIEENDKHGCSGERVITAKKTQLSQRKCSCLLPPPTAHSSMLGRLS